MRTKASILNALTMIIPQIIITVLNLIKTKFILDLMGIELLGIYQLFYQAVMYILVAEAGLTPVVMHKLYNPMAKKDQEKINSILSSARHMFNIVTFVMILLGLLLTLLIPTLINSSSISLIIIQASFMLFILSNIINYRYMYKQITFDVNQKKYINNILLQGITIFRIILEIIAIFTFESLIAIYIMHLFSSILYNLLLHIIYKKKYPSYTVGINKDIKIFSDVKHLIFHRVGYIITNNIDIILLTKFWDLSYAAIYGVYNYIISGINRILISISGATLAPIGDLIANKSGNLKKDFKDYNHFIMFLAIIILVPVSLVVNDFVLLWYGLEIAVNKNVVLLFMIIMYYKIIKIPIITFIEGGGLFKETKTSVIIEASINLTLSLILVGKYGIAGVLIATIIASFVGEYIIKLIYIKNKIFTKNDNISIFKSIVVPNILNLIIFIFFYYIIDFRVHGYFDLLMEFLVIGIINFIIIFIIYYLMGATGYLKRLKKIF